MLACNRSALQHPFDQRVDEAQNAGAKEAVEQNLNDAHAASGNHMASAPEPTAASVAGAAGPRPRPPSPPALLILCDQFFLTQCRRRIAASRSCGSPYRSTARYPRSRKYSPSVCPFCCHNGKQISCVDSAIVVTPLSVTVGVVPVLCVDDLGPAVFCEEIYDRHQRAELHPPVCLLAHRARLVALLRL